METIRDCDRRLAAIIDGCLRQPDEIRAVLANVRANIAMREREVEEAKQLLFDAEQAFLLGWPSTV